MKTLLYLLLFNISAISFAQDPQLFENTWYLQNVIIDGQDNYPPSNDEVPFVDLRFFEGSNMFLETNVCNNGSGVVAFDNSNSSFILTDGLAITLSDCDNPTNTSFEGIYFDFFLLNLNTPFIYNIIDNGNQSLSLIINSANGDQAIYGNELLSNGNFSASNFLIHPNPAKNELFLTSKNATENLKAKIFNIEGKLLSTQNLEFKKQVSVDVSSLSSGIYFLDIEDGNGNSTIKKFIKE